MRKFASLRYMDLTPPYDSVDRALRCVIIRRSTNEDIDYTLAQSVLSSAALELDAGEWFGVELFYSTKSRVLVM